MEIQSDKGSSGEESQGNEPDVPRPSGAWVIPPERMPGALERHKSMIEFVEMLESLEIGVAPPAMHFDPTWDDK